MKHSRMYRQGEESPFFGETIVLLGGLWIDERELDAYVTDLSSTKAIGNTPKHAERHEDNGHNSFHTQDDEDVSEFELEKQPNPTKKLRHQLWETPLFKRKVVGAGPEPKHHHDISHNSFDTNMGSSESKAHAIRKRKREEAGDYAKEPENDEKPKSMKKVIREPRRSTRLAKYSKETCSDPQEPEETQEPRQPRRSTRPAKPTSSGSEDSTIELKKYIALEDITIGQAKSVAGVGRPQWESPEAFIWYQERWSMDWTQMVTGKWLDGFSVGEIQQCLIDIGYGNEIELEEIQFFLRFGGLWWANLVGEIPV